MQVWMMKLPALAVLGILAMSCASCSVWDDMFGAEETLYDRIGGAAGADQITDQFIANVIADEWVGGRFARADMEIFKRLLAEQLCQLTGGPCVYSGRSMREAHEDMGITLREFAIVERHFAAALEAAGVAGDDKKTITRALKGMRDDIVGR